MTNSLAGVEDSRNHEEGEERVNHCGNDHVHQVIPQAEHDGGEQHLRAQQHAQRSDQRKSLEEQDHGRYSSGEQHRQVEQEGEEYVQSCRGGILSLLRRRFLGQCRILVRLPLLWCLWSLAYGVLVTFHKSL